MAAGEVRIAGDDRAGRADPRLAAPERAVRLLPVADPGRRRATPGWRRLPARSGRSASASATTRGSVRVFPRGARWDAPVASTSRRGSFGGARRSACDRGPAARSRPARARPGGGHRRAPDGPTAAPADGDPLAAFGDGRSGDRRYREARLEPGDPVTVVGRALPFGDLADPAEADWPSAAASPPTTRRSPADLAAARAGRAPRRRPRGGLGQRRRSRASASAGRSARRSSTPTPTGPPLAPAAEAARGRAHASTSRPTTLVLASARHARCSSPPAARRAPSTGTRTGSSSACSGRSSPSARRWSSPSCSPAGIGS